MPPTKTNTKDIERYRAEKAEIKAAAEKLEAESQEFEHKSDEAMHLHHRWAQAMTGIQVAISLAAVSLLTRRRWLNYATYLAAGAGVGAGRYGAGASVKIHAHQASGLKPSFVQSPGCRQ